MDSILSAWGGYRIFLEGGGQIYEFFAKILRSYSIKLWVPEGGRPKGARPWFRFCLYCLRSSSLIFSFVWPYCYLFCMNYVMALLVNKILLLAAVVTKTFCCYSQFFIITFLLKKHQIVFCLIFVVFSAFYIRKGWGKIHNTGVHNNKN